MKQFTLCHFLYVDSVLPLQVAKPIRCEHNSTSRINTSHDFIRAIDNNAKAGKRGTLRKLTFVSGEDLIFHGRVGICGNIVVICGDPEVQR